MCNIQTNKKPIHRGKLQAFQKTQMLDTPVRYQNNSYKHVLKTKEDYAKRRKRKG